VVGEREKKGRSMILNALMMIDVFHGLLLAQWIF